MIGKYKKVMIAFLILVAVFIRIISYYPGIIEQYYSNGIYPYISKTLKYSFGWIPFSLGDTLYCLLIAWIIYKIASALVNISRRKISKKIFIDGVLNLLFVMLVVYVLFNVLWGLNYNRRGIASQLNLEMKKYSKEELVVIDSMLLMKANEYRAALDTHNAFPQKFNTFGRAKKAYDKISAQYPFAAYTPSSVKSSFFGTLGNYLGFTGYYNPFTGEAQLNTTVPKFLHPFTTCHEIAHQLGYAKENEANFVGYLAASNADDTIFRYSVYLDLYLYAQRNLYNADSASARNISTKMLPAVKNDLISLRQFYERHRNPFEPIFRWIYGKYLQSNGQPSGLLAYDEVTGFLIAFNKKFGKL